MSAGAPADTTAWRALLLHDVEQFNAQLGELPISERVMFAGADLSGLDLAGAWLHSLDLSGANLSQSSVAGFWLSTCRLQGVVLDDIVLDDEYWRDPILQITALWNGAEAWTEIRRSKVPLLLNQSNFAGATLNDIDLSDVAFVSSVFTGAYFAGTGLDRCSFRGADLNATDFQGVTCRGLSLEEAQLSDSRWTDVAMSDGKFVEADLRRSVFRGCTFDNVNFNDSTATDARFEQCRFVGCIFYDADLSKSTFNGCEFTDTVLEHGNVEGVIIS